MATVAVYVILTEGVSCKRLLWRGRDFWEDVHACRHGAIAQA